MSASSILSALLGLPTSPKMIGGEEYSTRTCRFDDGTVKSTTTHSTIDADGRQVDTIDVVVTKGCSTLEKRHMVGTENPNGSMELVVTDDYKTSTLPNGTTVTETTDRKVYTMSAPPKKRESNPLLAAFNEFLRPTDGNRASDEDMVGAYGGSNGYDYGSRR